MSTMHVGPIEELLVADHVRLDRILRDSERDDGTIDEATYAVFRHDLLRHIAMEEKVLLPFARERRGGAPLEMATQLRKDHGAIAKLLVRSPTASIVSDLRELLGRHNPLEEGPSGLYAICDALAGGDTAGVIARLDAQPRVPVAKYYDGPLHRKA